MSARKESRVVELEVSPSGAAMAAPEAREHTVDRVVVTDMWNRFRNPIEALAHAARLLRPGGMLEVIEHHQAISFRDMVRVLANQGWAIHGCEEADGGFSLRAAIRDESVTS